MAEDPQAMWKRFIAHLNAVDPLTFVTVKDGKPNIKTLPHASFLGSITKYEKLFVEANTPVDPKPGSGMMSP